MFDLNTIKSLVEQSPFTYPDVPDYLYLGSKVINVININIENGKIVKEGYEIDSDNERLSENHDINEISEKNMIDNLTIAKKEKGKY